MLSQGNVPMWYQFFGESPSFIQTPIDKRLIDMMMMMRREE